MAFLPQSRHRMKWMPAPLRAAVVGALLTAAAFPAHAQNAWPNLPANTVLGRLAIGTGPAQAIPFATLAAQLNGSISATANQIPVYPGNGTNAVPTTIGGSGGLFDAICSSTIGQIWVRLSSGWGCTSLGYANPVWWGADPSGTNDSTTALNSTFSALPSGGGQIAFPAGKFKFNSTVTMTMANALSSLTLQGAGQDATILYFPTANNGVQIIGSNVLNTAHVRDLSITTGKVGATGSALTLQTGIALGNVLGSDVSHVWFGGDDRTGIDYWTYGVSDASWSGVSYMADTFYGPAAGGAGTGILLTGTTSLTFAQIIANISHSNFFNLETGLLIGPYVQGVTVFQDVFAGSSQTAINVLSGESGLDQLTIIGSEFNTSVNDIIVSSVFPNIFISHNLFYVPSGGSGVFLVDNDIFTITGNVFAAVTSSDGDGVVVGTSSSGASGTVNANVFNALGIGVDLQSGSTNVNVQGNTFVANSSAVTNAGTGHVIANNLGYNPVGPTGPNTVGASPATICAGAAPETHYYFQSATDTATVKLGGSGGPLVGTMTYPTVPVVVDLGPNECDYITWATTAPTYTKSVH